MHKVERDDSNLEISKTVQMKTHVKPFNFVKDFLLVFFPKFLSQLQLPEKCKRDEFVPNKNFVRKSSLQFPSKVLFNLQFATIFFKLLKKDSKKKTKLQSF